MALLAFDDTTFINLMYLWNGGDAGREEEGSCLMVDSHLGPEDNPNVDS